MLSRTKQYDGENWNIILDTDVLYAAKMAADASPLPAIVVDGHNVVQYRNNVPIAPDGTIPPVRFASCEVCGVNTSLITERGPLCLSCWDRQRGLPPRRPWWTPALEERLRAAVAGRHVEVFHEHRATVQAYQSNDLDQELADAAFRWSGEWDRCGDPDDFLPPDKCPRCGSTRVMQIDESGDTICDECQFYSTAQWFSPTQVSDGPSCAYCHEDTKTIWPENGSFPVAYCFHCDSAQPEQTVPSYD